MSMREQKPVRLDGEFIVMGMKSRRGAEKLVKCFILRVRGADLRPVRSCRFLSSSDSSPIRVLILEIV